MKAESITIVIFGASGDLTKRKLIPALYSLYSKRRLPGIINIVGFGRTKMSVPEFRNLFQIKTAGGNKCKTPDKGKWGEFSERLFYFSGEYNSKEDFRSLSAYLDEVEKGNAHRLYYLATPPGAVTEIVGNMGKCGMTEEEKGWRRVIIEKPFGHDLSSARELNLTLHNILN